MNTLTQEALIQQLNWRYAVKKFDATKKIPANLWTAIEDALVLTPSSYGLQPWKFLVIENPEIRNKLLPVSWNQRQVVDCSHFVVLAGRTSLDSAYIANFIDETANQRSMPRETIAGYEKMMAGDLLNGPRSKIQKEWAIRQVYIALGNLMTSAAVLGVDTCAMEGIDPVKYDEILNLNSTDYRTAVACAVGYRAADDKYSSAKKIRFTKDRMIQKI